MKAVRFHEHGGLDVLKYEDAPEPDVRPGEVLVKVRACALNHLDLWLRMGMPGVKIPLPHIVGSDVSGEIAGVGEGVEGIKEGERVLVSPNVSCGKCEACLSGKDNFCRSYTILGSMVDGGYAQYVKVPAANMLPYPEGMDFSEASSIPLVFLTAWHMMIGLADIQPGEEILVLGAGSGVGSAAIQIGKLFNARVITTAGSDEKLEKARSLGADEVINHGTQDIAKEVKRITEKRGVSLVIEHIGPAVWEPCFRSLKAGGRLVTCGATTGPEASFNIRALFARQLTIMGSYMGNKGELAHLLQFFSTGQFKPVVHQVFPLEEARAAQLTMEERKHFGKIVLGVE